MELFTIGEGHYAESDVKDAARCLTGWAVETLLRSELFEDKRLSIVQGVGYPNPNRSHDVSMAIWQTARFDHEDHNGYGWIGRALDALPEPITEPLARFCLPVQVSEAASSANSPTCRYSATTLQVTQSTFARCMPRYLKNGCRLNPTVR